MESLRRIFARYPEEAMIVGRLLAGYGELEFALCHCVGEAIADNRKVLKAVFGVRGEKARVDRADALGRPAYCKMRLEAQFTQAVAAIHHCREIRNQFAHCTWHDDNTGKLGFVRLEEVATGPQVTDLRNITIDHLDVPLLQRQETYFKYVWDCLAYLNFEAQTWARKLPKNPRLVPKPVSRPDLYLARARRSRPAGTRQTGKS